MGKSPKQFLAMYGTHYVHEVTESTSFLGNVMFKSKATEWKKKLSVAASMSVKQATWSASVDTSVNINEAKKDKDTEMTVSASYQGQFTPFDATVEGVKAMQGAFMDWQERVKETPEKMGKPTRMQFRSYFDAEEMQMLLLEQEDWVIEAFMGDAPSKEVMRIMTQEY